MYLHVDYEVNGGMYILISPTSNTSENIFIEIENGWPLDFKPSHDPYQFLFRSSFVQLQL